MDAAAGIGYAGHRMDVAMNERWLVCYLGGSDEVAIRFDASPHRLMLPDAGIAMVPVKAEAASLDEWFSSLKRQALAKANADCLQVSFHQMVDARTFERLCPQTYIVLIDGTCSAA